MFKFRYRLYIQGLAFLRWTDIKKYNSIFIPGLSRTGDPKACMALIGDLDSMDFFPCYAGFACEETHVDR